VRAHAVDDHHRVGWSCLGLLMISTPPVGPFERLGQECLYRVGKIAPFGEVAEQGKTLDLRCGECELHLPRAGTLAALVGSWRARCAATASPRVGIGHGDASPGVRTVARFFQSGGRPAVHEIVRRLLRISRGRLPTRAREAPDPPRMKQSN
jgi:hypothetical protein